MKKLKVIALVLATVSFVQVYAQNASENSLALNEEAKNAPLIEWKSQSHNFGEISRNQPVTVEFEFTNSGNAALVISEVKASCGCTATGYPKQAVQPGESAKIIATYDAKALGNFMKSIRVVSSSPEGTHTLTIKGTVI